MFLYKYTFLYFLNILVNLYFLNTLVNLYLIKLIYIPKSQFSI